MSKQISMLIRSPTYCPFRVPIWYRCKDGETYIRSYECNFYPEFDCPDDDFSIYCPLSDVNSMGESI